MKVSILSHVRAGARHIGALISVVTVVGLLGVSPALGQDFGGTVTQDPSAGTVTYTFQFDNPPAGSDTLSIALPVDPNKILPGSIIAPPNWNGVIVPPGGSFWNYDPLVDPKFLAGILGPDPNVWLDPFLIVWTATDLANAILPGVNIGGFGFQSPFLPINAPAQFQVVGGQVFTIDPPTPGDVPVPEPATAGVMGFAAAYLLNRRSKRRG